MHKIHLPYYVLPLKFWRTTKAKNSNYQFKSLQNYEKKLCVNDFHIPLFVEIEAFFCHETSAIRDLIDCFSN